MGVDCSKLFGPKSDSSVATESSIQKGAIRDLNPPSSELTVTSTLMPTKPDMDFVAENQSGSISRFHESMGILSEGPGSISGPRPTVVEFIGDCAIRQRISETQFADGHFAKFLKFVHRGVIGVGELMDGPFGSTQIIYCDWTASGRQFAPIERYLYSHVSTLYANTHTDTSVTGVQSTRYFHEAREIVLESVGGNPELDTVIFAGSGASGAMDKLMRVISNWSPSIKEECAVFVSAMEHNTNLLLWADNGFTVVTVPATLSGELLDIEKLEELLIKWSEKRKHLFCSFIAASNVTGILADTEGISRICHKWNAFVFWDYATAGPYVDIAMTNDEDPALNKDAVFIATHKFLGGPSAPGLLIAKKNLFRNSIPAIPAGGTVTIAFGNRPGQYEYHSDIPAKEEAGTQDIIGAVRAAMCLSLKNQIGTDVIGTVEREFSEKFIERVVKQNPNIYVLGGVDGDIISDRKLPIFSINIVHTKISDPSDTRALHCNFVAALLNDLFGIQGRPGCMCAGVYIRYLLGVSDISHYIEEHKKGTGSISVPGLFRLNFHYSMAPDEFDFVCSAIDWVCKHGWKLLPLYSVNGKTSDFRNAHWRSKSDTQLRSLHDIKWDRLNGKLDYPMDHVRSKSLKSFSKVLSKANSILDSLEEYLPPSLEAANEMVTNFTDEQPWYFLPNELYHDAIKYCTSSTPTSPKRSIPPPPQARRATSAKTDQIEVAVKQFGFGKPDFSVEPMEVIEVDFPIKESPLKPRERTTSVYFLSEARRIEERKKIIDGLLEDRVVTDQSFRPTV